MRRRKNGLRAYEEDPTLSKVVIFYADHDRDEEQDAIQAYVRDWRKANPYKAFYFWFQMSEISKEVLFFRTKEAEMHFRLGWNFKQKI